MPGYEMEEQPHHADLRALAGLLGRIAKRDNDAFEEFFAHTRKEVFATILAVLVSRELSEDTSQEVYIQVWNTAHRFDPARGSPMAWLLTIARRRAVDHVRAEQSHRNRLARFASDNHITDHDVVAEAATKIFEAEDVNRHLLSLSALQHAAINLAFFDGLTYAEVAFILNVPLPTVKSRIRDSLSKLRHSMAEPSSARFRLAGGKPGGPDRIIKLSPLTVPDSCVTPPAA
ncbi:sigma-70 family RNA polymerase sigma factor [Arthrobacter sp. SO3]|uniref:sigma-70 family RNA polymerase sigma factor n=1 Tax=Arthrobacter sp. SO3 TaxID=1897057 RepID=UPI001CFFC920|nr:sigma-70 family RNA polymerase sigma factor [Arthrobacter sp. SO3]